MQYPYPSIIKTAHAWLSLAFYHFTVGIILSIAAEYVPGFSAWWGGQSAADKVRWRAVLALVITVTVGALEYAGVVDVLPAAPLPALSALVAAFVAFIGGAEVNYGANWAMFPRKQGGV